MGQQPCLGSSATDSAADLDGVDELAGEDGPRACIGTAHAQEVHRKVLSLAEKYGWRTEPEVEEALARTDLPSYRRILKKHRVAEPRWDEAVHGAYAGDSRVQRLAAGGFVFEDLCVYTVLVQLLHPALAREGAGQKPPRVLDVGCGTGFLTAVLARLVAPRGGSVVAIDMFARQVEHAQRTMSACCPELLPHVSFAVANGLEYADPSGRPFDAIAVACQATEVPQTLVRQLAPGGYLVAPVGRPAPKDKGKAGPYHKYWLVKKGPDGSVVFSGRAGPIGVNFVPLLPPARPLPPEQPAPVQAAEPSAAPAPAARGATAAQQVGLVPLLAPARGPLPREQAARQVVLGSPHVAVGRPFPAGAAPYATASPAVLSCNAGGGTTSVALAHPAAPVALSAAGLQAYGAASASQLLPPGAVYIGASDGWSRRALPAFPAAA